LERLLMSMELTEGAGKSRRSSSSIIIINDDDMTAYWQVKKET